jgi:murein DD-endopeptidase MepM/ murein hydrolase activator NlpD
VPSRRYTIIVADRTTGVLRRFTIRLRPTVLTIAALLVLPVLIGLGARQSASSELSALRATATQLEIENTSYRAATRELTSQIASLQTTVTDLGVRSSLDAASAKAMAKLPSTIRASAMGGSRDTVPASLSSLFSPTQSSPEDTFGVLRELLTRLESRLQLVRTDVERRAALAAATPSIWPAHGWLSAGFGEREDPFNGSDEFHTGLDISADKGRPVYATAAGKVESAAYSGAYGNMLVVDHGFGLMTRYAHLSGFAVKVGQRVQRGTVVGYVGATGRATGAHLHYEVLVNGKLINPLRLLLEPRP